MSLRERYGLWAVVLGGSEGIGASFARLVAREGVNVVLVARHEAPLAATADAVRAEGVDARVLALDLTEPTAVADIARATDDVDVGLVVYNAGAVHAGDEFLDRPVDFALNLVRLNCEGPVRVCHHYGARMVERGRGGILLVGSMSGVAGAGRTVVYGASKAFVHGLAEGLWYELKPKGVDVLGLVAGATRTPAMARSGALVERFEPMDPDDVAREGLEHLADGPLWLPNDLTREFFGVLHTMSRADAVEAMSAGGRLIWGIDDPA
jgi:short-subunit dehydrogenase